MSTEANNENKTQAGGDAAKPEVKSTEAVLYGDSKSQDGNGSAGAGSDKAGAGGDATAAAADKAGADADKTKSGDSDPGKKAEGDKAAAGAGAGAAGGEKAGGGDGAGAGGDKSKDSGKDGAGGGGDAKPGGAAGDAGKVDYKFKIPEDSILSDKDIEDVRSFAADKKLTVDQAQDVLEQRSRAVTKFHVDQQNFYKETVKGWETELRKDKEIGGDKYNETMTLTRELIDKHADAKTKAEIEQSGYINHPGFVRFLHKIAKAGKNDSFVNGNSQRTEILPTKDIMYGGTSEKKS